MTSSSARLIISDSEKDSNLFYATRFLAPDPFVFLEIGTRKMLIMSDLELDRARDQASVNEVHSSSQIKAELKKSGKERPSLADVVEHYLKKAGVNELLVPANFPIEYADPLREKGFNISFKQDPFFEERVLKRAEEIEWISKTQRATEQSVEKAVDVIRSSEIRADLLYHEGEVLTSERIRRIIDLRLMELGCVAQHTIISCAADCVDPHNVGAGPLKAHQSIILDVFPRSSETRYFADMTRTVVRGKASEKLRKMYAAVLEGQEIAFRMIRDGVDGRDVHQAIQNLFNAQGFHTGQMEGRFQGFFHGTGHGVGLDIHESPRINQDSQILKEGHVVTVEPGLYYLDAGGVRLEDMALVTKNGCENLTRFPKVLEI